MGNNGNTEDLNVEESTLSKYRPFLLILIIVLFWIGYPFILYFIDHFWPTLQLVNKIGTYGTFGDTYGALNTLFSGLAFGLLIISLFMQREELQEQRKELAAQRGEITKSNEIAEQQRLITGQQKDLNEQQIHDAKVQNFYNLLFRFLDEKRRKIENLELARESKTRGSYVFEYFLNGALRQLKARFLYAEHIENDADNELDHLLEDLIKDGHIASRNSLVENEYFEYICFILRFIEDHETLGIIDTAIKIFVSYQSINEMSCMFIISLEDEELKGYITKYALLRKFNTYEGDKHLLTLVDRTLGEKSYCP